MTLAVGVKHRRKTSNTHSLPPPSCPVSGNIPTYYHSLPSPLHHPERKHCPNPDTHTVKGLMGNWCHNPDPYTPRGPPLKKSCFRWSGRVSILLPTGNFFFFFFFALSLFFGVQNFIIFLPKKKGKKDFAATRLATISATRWTGNKLYLRLA